MRVGITQEVQHLLGRDEAVCCGRLVLIAKKGLGFTRSTLVDKAHAGVLTFEVVFKLLKTIMNVDNPVSEGRIDVILQRFHLVWLVDLATAAGVTSDRISTRRITMVGRASRVITTRSLLLGSTLCFPTTLTTLHFRPCCS